MLLPQCLITCCARILSAARTPLQTARRTCHHPLAAATLKGIPPCPTGKPSNLLHRLRRSRSGHRFRIARGGRGEDVGLGHFVSATRRRKTAASRRSDRRALRRLGRRSGARGGHDHLGRHRGVQRRRGAVGQAASCRHIRFSSTSTPYRLAASRRPPNFSAMPRAMSMSPCSRPFIRRAIRRRCCLPGRMREADRGGARRARHAREHRRQRNRRSRRHQDGAQRDDQRHRGADAGMLSRGVARRRDRRGRHVDEEQLSGTRLDERSFPTTSNAWRPMASAAPPKWKKSPTRCANLASTR